MKFQDIILNLQTFWTENGCILWQPYDIEVGAGTMNPATFLRVLGPEEWNVCYVEPSRRPKDGRYGENPNRLQHYYQFQVILKPGMEITQFTYFQQAGSIDLEEISVEITYGLERIAMFLQNVESVYDILWADGLTYGDIYKEAERQWSIYNFEEADIEMLKKTFEMFEREGFKLIKKKLPIPAYDYALKCSHTFNLLDARGALSVTERARYIARVRNLSRECAKAFLKHRRELGFPMQKKQKAEV